MTISRKRLRRAAVRRKAHETHRALARRSFLHFCTFVYDGFITAPHHIQIANKLDAVTAGLIKRLHIALPPRHSKSLMCSELFPAFWFGHYPKSNIIHSSYAASLSNKFSFTVRATISDNSRYHELFPNIALHPLRKRLDDWQLVTGGGFRSVGVTAGITGSGAGLFIIDDAHKEGDELSPITLDKIWYWFASAAMTRLDPGAPVLVPMTRWGVNDIAGRFLRLQEEDPNADKWETLIYPALALENDPLGRQPGEPLWPERYNLSRLLAIKAISERYFEALFQQNPKFHDEPLFTKANFKRGKISAKTYFWTFDLAITEKERSDYTVAGRWSFENDILALHDIHRFRAQWPEVSKFLTNLLRNFPIDKFYFPPHLLELFAVQTLRDKATNPHRIEQIEQPGDKRARAAVLSDYCKNGTVLICPGENGDIFVQEHTGFQETAKHDDCVDVSSVASHAIGLQNRFYLEIRGEKDDKHRPQTAQDLGY